MTFHFKRDISLSGYTMAAVSSFSILGMMVLGGVPVHAAHSPATDSSAAPFSSEAEPDSPSTRSKSLVAQWFYPEGDQSIVQVIGIGQVSQPADQAIVTLPFSPRYEPAPLPDGVLSQFGWEEPDPLTIADLQPVVDALIEGGLETSAVEPKIIPYQIGGFSFPFPSGSSLGGAVIMLTLDSPQISVLDQAVETVQRVVEDSDRLEFGAPRVKLSLEDCMPLEQESYQAAVTSAQARAEAIAMSLDVELSTPAISEPFYSPVLSGCYGDSLSVFGGTDEPYVPGMDLAIELVKQLFFSYPIE